jgi:hypothetical protein
MTLVAAACGDEGTDGETVSFKKGGPPAPRTCVDRWNADQGALAFGRHAYLPGHNSRAGRVFSIDEPRRNLKNGCVVVFAAAESDREYGTVGWFDTEAGSANTGAQGEGWRVISLLPGQTQEQLIALQRSAAEQANVALDESGAIAPFPAQ